MIRLVVQTLCLILSTPFVRAADPPTCDGISATRRIVGYYDTYFAGTPCGTPKKTLLAQTQALTICRHISRISEACRLYSCQRCSCLDRSKQLHPRYRLSIQPGDLETSGDCQRNYAWLASLAVRRRMDDELPKRSDLGDI